METMRYTVGGKDFELQHHGVKGMRWGVRKKKYTSTSVGAAMARRANEKVDKSFDKWKENAQKRDNAIALGKRATAAKLAYESDRSNKNLRKAYKDADREYQKALSGNTSYRKGAIRAEVGKDLARKYLSQAKKVQKQLAADPSNKKLQKQYNDLMSKHDIERARARRAPEVGEKRSRAKANLKRAMTMTVKAAAATAAMTAGAYAVNRYLSNHDVIVNGKPVRIGVQNISDAVGVAKKVKDFMGFMW